jgi:Apoptosis antagonizing transcription factor
VRPTREETESEQEEEEGEVLEGTGASQEEEMTKAIHTKNQLQLWDDIMSIRIMLQPVSLI